jgi:ABC-type multidrug transport system ATPase subunit
MICMRPGQTCLIQSGVTALENLSLRIYKGEISCLPGQNGAGKTTTINAKARTKILV